MDFVSFLLRETFLGIYLFYLDKWILQHFMGFSTGRYTWMFFELKIFWEFNGICIYASNFIYKSDPIVTVCVSLSKQKSMEQGKPGCINFCWKHYSCRTNDIHPILQQRRIFWLKKHFFNTSQLENLRRKSSFSSFYLYEIIFPWQTNIDLKYFLLPLWQQEQQGHNEEGKKRSLLKFLWFLDEKEHFNSGAFYEE